MFERLVEFINGLEQQELKEMYEKYTDVAFTFYIDGDLDKYERSVTIVNLIDKALRDKGIWNNK